MTFTFKLSRRLAPVLAAACGAAFVGCSIDQPVGSVPFVPSAFLVAAGDTLFSDGFESDDFVWDHDDNAASKQMITAAARTGARGLRVTFSPTTAAGTLSKFVTRGDRVYVRAAVRFPSNWTGATGLLTLRAAPASDQWASLGVRGQCPTGTWAVSGVTLTTPNLDPRFNTSYVGMPTNSAGLCEPGPGLSGPSTATYTAPFDMSKGVWHTVEIEAQLNTVGSADGWQRVWLDGVLTGEWNGLTFRTTSTVEWNHVSLEMPSSGVTETQSLDIDDIVVHRERPAEEPTPLTPLSPLTPLPPTGGNPWSNEPAGLELVSDYGFGDVVPDHGSWHNGPYAAGWDIVNHRSSNGYVERVTDPSAPHSSGFVAQINYPQDYEGGGEPTAIYRNVAAETEVYYGFYWKASPSWQNHPSGVNKIWFQWFGSVGGSGGAMLMVWRNADYIILSTELSTETYRNLEPNVTRTPVRAGEWYFIECYINKETGLTMWWVNGQLNGQWTIPYPSQSFSQFEFAPTWGGVGDTKGHNDWYRVDHIRISKR